jgi:hypothetical protein
VSRVAAASIVTCGSLFLGAVAGQAAPPLAGFGFRTPSGNIVCNRGLATTGAPGVSCVAFSESSATRGQASWLVGPSGRARFRFVLGNIGTDVPVLAYGRSWRRYRIVCVSRSTGLTCRNPAGHGFTLSRERQRIF